MKIITTSSVEPIEDLPPEQQLEIEYDDWEQFCDQFAWSNEVVRPPQRHSEDRASAVIYDVQDPDLDGVVEPKRKPVFIYIKD